MAAVGAVLKPGGSKIRLSGFLARFQAMLPHRLVILGLSAPPQEHLLGCCGLVEIRQAQGGLAAQTRVKGEQEQAIETALQRLHQLMVKNGRSGLNVRLQRPLVQSEEEPGRWLVRIGLVGADKGIVSPASRGGRVKIVSAAPAIVAVLRVSGRATARSIDNAAEVILGSLKGSPWRAAGGPVVRLDGLFSAVPFLAHFEVGVPVIAA